MYIYIYIYDGSQLEPERKMAICSEGFTDAYVGYVRLVCTTATYNI